MAMESPVIAIGMKRYIRFAGYGWDSPDNITQYLRWKMQSKSAKELLFSCTLRIRGSKAFGTHS